MTIIFILVSSVNNFSSSDLISASCWFLCTISPFMSIHFHPWSSPLGCFFLWKHCYFFFLFFFWLERTQPWLKILRPHCNHWLIYWPCEDIFKLLSSISEWLSGFLSQRLISKLTWNKSYLTSFPHVFLEIRSYVYSFWHTEELA